MINDRFKNSKFLPLKIIIASLVFFSRFLNLPANFSPLGSYGFFGQNLLFYLLNFLLYDAFFGGFYPGVFFTYLGFLAYYFFGQLARRSTNQAAFHRFSLIYLPLASLVFFLLSNFGVWWYWYPRTLDGLILCYALALPFYRQTFLGDLFFGWGYILLRIFYFKYRQKFNLGRFYFGRFYPSRHLGQNLKN